MTDPSEDDLRRALDDVLATCWADEIRFSTPSPKQ